MKTLTNCLRTIFCIVWFGLLSSHTLLSQPCGDTKEDFMARQSSPFRALTSSCTDWADYHVLDEFDTPIKTIRLTFHIF